MKRLTPLMFGLAMAFGMSGAAMAQGAPGGAPDQGGAPQGGGAPDAGGAPQGGGAPDAGGAPPAQGGGMPGEQQAADFDDEDIQTFAEVQPEIEEIREDYASQLQDADDPERAAELQNEAGQKMVDTVTDAGLEVETYNNIAIALQSDAELREDVESRM